jgi:hypothetical protein
MYKDITLGRKEWWSCKTGDLLKRGSNYMKVTITGEKNVPF